MRDYESIAGLLVHEEVRGPLLICTFACPDSGQHVQAQAVLVGDWGGVRRPQNHELLVTEHVYHVVAAAVAEINQPPALCSEALRRSAVVRAFRSVADGFAGCPPGFQRQLSQAPVQVGYDRWVLARILTQVMRADGKVVEEELSFFGVYRGVGRSLEELAAMPPLNAVELAQVSPGPVRDTMLMLAWALSMVDLRLDARELSCLRTIAEGLGIPSERARELKAYAQAHISALSQA